MLTRLAICLLAAAAISCQTTPPPAAPAPAGTGKPAGTLSAAATVPARALESPSLDQWIGVYSSPLESKAVMVVALDRLTADVTSVEKSPGGVAYRMWYKSDGPPRPNAIEQEEEWGQCLIDGPTICIPRAAGYWRSGKPQVFAHIQRYTWMKIAGRPVLMRDDALKIYREEGTLYERGILFKVSDSAGPVVLKDAQRVSGKQLGQ